MKLSGTALAEKKIAEIKKCVQESGLLPKLAVIRIGNDEASRMYVRRKQKISSEVGITLELFEFEIAHTEKIIALVHELNARADIHAILIQLPLPRELNTDAIIAAIDPKKDVDGFHTKNIGAFMSDAPVQTPVLLLAIEWLLQETGEILAHKVACIIGKSDVFLKPLAHALEKQGLQTSWIKPEELHSSELTSHADVLIVAVGSPHFITPEFIKPGAIIIDIGINRLADGRVVGDVDFESAARVAAWITPTPGGVGPVTIAALMWNTLQLAIKSRTQ